MIMNEEKLNSELELILTAISTLIKTVNGLNKSMKFLDKKVRDLNENCLKDAIILKQIKAESRQG